MLKRILTLLGETPSSSVARTLSYRLAHETGARIAGLAGIDLADIEAPEAVPPGGMAFKVELERELKKQAGEARRRLCALYDADCKSEGLPFECLSFEGDPVSILQLASETRDLIVTGHDTAFYGKMREALPAMLAWLLQNTPRPVIVCPDMLPAGDDILIAYDGSLPAMRSVQLFALLGIGAGKRIHAVSIDPDQELAVRRSNAAALYLRSHGYLVEVIPIVSESHPAEILDGEIARLHAGTLVMGAYGHRGWREFLFGSTTAALVEEPRCALFIYR